LLLFAYSILSQILVSSLLCCLARLWASDRTDDRAAQRWNMEQARAATEAEAVPVAEAVED